MSILGSLTTAKYPGREGQLEAANSKLPDDVELPANAVGGNREFALFRAATVITHYPDILPTTCKCPNGKCRLDLTDTIERALYSIARVKKRDLRCPFPCCVVTCKQQMKLGLHVELAHDKEQWTCPTCNKTMSFDLRPSRRSSQIHGVQRVTKSRQTSVLT